MGEGSRKAIKMFSYHFYNPPAFFLTALFLSVTLNACSSSSQETPRLHVINRGLYPIENLVIWFPEAQINFGNVPAGATTKYIEVLKGVFRYSAYQFEIDGEMITQPVIDFMGEEPLDGTLFTYTIDFDPSRVTHNDAVRLISVNVDE